MDKESTFVKILRSPLRFPGIYLVILALALGSFITFKAYLEVGTVSVDEIMRQVNLTMDRGGHIQFRLNSPMGKPIVYGKNDFEILEYDHQNSFLEVDGVKKSLWSGTFNYSVNRRDKQIFYSASFPFEKDQSSVLIVEEVASFVDKNKVKVDYYFIFDRKPESTYQVKNITLTLSHLPTIGFTNLVKKDSAITGTALSVVRKPKNVGMVYLPFEIKTQGNLSGELGESQFSNLKGFVTAYSLAKPEKDHRVLVASETVSF